MSIRFRLREAEKAVERSEAAGGNEQELRELRHALRLVIAALEHDERA